MTAIVLDAHIHPKNINTGLQLVFQAQINAHQSVQHGGGAPSNTWNIPYYTDTQPKTYATMHLVHMHGTHVHSCRTPAGPLSVITELSVWVKGTSHLVCLSCLGINAIQRAVSHLAYVLCNTLQGTLSSCVVLYLQL